MTAALGAIGASSSSSSSSVDVDKQKQKEQILKRLNAKVSPCRGSAFYPEIFNPNFYLYLPSFDLHCQTSCNIFFV